LIELIHAFSILTLIKEVNMRVIISIITIFALVCTVGIPISEADKGSRRYTAYNIWKASKMKCINFKQGTDMIPAGTKVNDVRLVKQDRFPPLLYFTTVKDGRKYTISFTERWHPNKSMKDYRRMMFTNKNFEALTERLSEMEIDAIKKGVLVNGMSKRAVLICFGPPPEHYTPDQNASTWYYWANRKDKIEIKFDRDGKLALGDQSSQVDIKKESKRLLAAKKAESKPPIIFDKGTDEVKATLTVSEEKVSASLLITCTNEKSVVYIRQGGKWKNKGKPPCYMKNISPGSYTIKVEGTDPWGYDQVYEQTVRVHMGEAVTVSIKLEALKQGVGGGIGTGKNTAEIKRSKITANSASEAQVAAIPKVKVSKKEPWTGIWKVEGSGNIGSPAHWGMKQRRKKVVSTKDSYYELKGNIKGNQLKGRVISGHGLIYRFVVNISSDDQTFEGIIDDTTTTNSIIKGKRID
jgi:hypothetical protein